MGLNGSDNSQIIISSFELIFSVLYSPKLAKYKKDIQFWKLCSSNNNHIFLFHVYILHKPCFLLLAFDLSLVLQHGHIISDVEKNNAHKEHHLCPILYFKLLANDLCLNLIHNPLHVCAITFQSLANIFKKISKSFTNFFRKQCGKDLDIIW